MLDDPKRAIGDAIAHAEPIGPATGPHAEQARHGNPAAPQPEGGDFDAGDGPAPFGDYDGDENGPSDLPPDGSVDLAIVEYCAALDHSDTDNGERLRRHFGKDLVVMRQAGAKTPVFVTWSDTFWDTDGMPGALRIAQLLGSRIALEAAFLKPTPDEVAAMRRASEAAEELDALEDLDNPTEAQSLLFIILIGALADADATFAVTMEHGNQANLSDAAAVPAAQISGTLALAGFTFAADDQVRKVGYLGSKRYVRLTITPTGNTGNAFIAAAALLGDPRFAPPPNPPV
jgi:hypothetical protein